MDKVYGQEKQMLEFKAANTFTFPRFVADAILGLLPLFIQKALHLRKV